MANVYSVGGGIDDIVDRFQNVFSGVGKLSGYQLKMHIDPEVKPVAQKPGRIPYPLKEKVTKKLNELLDLNITEKVSCPATWVSTAVIAPKPNKDDVRICVDIRCANEAIRSEKLPTPTVDEVLEELNGSTVFSKLDMNMGFHQIELEEGSKDITTFSAGDSLFSYKRLSFGINSAPEQHQNIVRQTIAWCPGATNIADDIVVHGKTTKDHDRNLVALLNRLQEISARYSQTEKEVLVVVSACQRYRLYLSGLQSFELVTDCMALEAIYGPRSEPSARDGSCVLCPSRTQCVVYPQARI